MPRYRHILVFGIGLIACCLLIIGVVVSRQLTRLASDEAVQMRSAEAQDAFRDGRIEEAYRMRRLILLSLMLTVIGGAIVAAQVATEVKRRRRSEEELRRALHEVDERVRERTRELSDANDRLEVVLDARALALSREQQAREAAERANELKDRFLSTVSHELRTPLNAIVGWVHVIRSGSASGPQHDYALAAIDRNARTQEQLITDLLDVSHMIQGRLAVAMVDTDLREPVDRAVHDVGPDVEAKGVRLGYERCPEEIHVIGDAERLRQVVSNLLSNAVKFTPAGGWVTIELCSAPDARAEIRVRDSGEGIAPDVLQHVFEPFFQGRTRAMRAGMGLGLSIVKEVVSLHDGTVSVTSPGAGRGAAFAVTLPLAAAPRAAIAPAR